MKFLGSLLVSSIFIISQSLALCYATEAQGTNGLFSSKDIRLKLADAIQAKGEYLQKIADTEGIEAADHEFDLMAQNNLEAFFIKTRESVKNMSEQESKDYLSQLQNSGLEEVGAILADPGKSSKEKLSELYTNQNYEHFKNDIEKIKSEVHAVGYKKAFTDLASQMRDRSHDDGSYSDGGDTVILVLVLILLVAVLVLAIITPPQPAYYVVGSGCGGYMVYHHHYYSDYPGRPYYGGHGHY